MRHGRTLLHWLALVSLVVGALAATSPSLQAALSYVVNNTSGSSSGTEIVSFTADKRFVYVVGSNSSVRRVRAFPVNPDGTLSNTEYQFNNFNTAAPVSALNLDAPVASSIATHPTENYAIATIRGNANITDTGRIGGALFLTINTQDSRLDLARTGVLRLGRAPESIAIAPNGQYAVVANKDPGSGVGNNNRGGTISVIDLRQGPSGATVLATLSPTVPSGDTRKTDDPAPETVAISPDSQRIYVSLYENSALAIITINPTTLTTSMSVRPFPKQPVCGVGCGDLQLLPDGIAVTPDNKYLVTANKGVGTVRPDSVSILQINSPTSVTMVADSGRVISDTVVAQNLPRSSRGSEPEMVALGEVGGQLKAFVTLSASNAVAVFNVNPTAAQAERLVLDRIVPLRDQTTAIFGTGPEGIALANTYSNQTLAVTANTGTRNLSAITANGDPVAVKFSQPSFSAREDGVTATITATLSGSSFQEVRVNYSAANGTAQAGVHYNLTPGTLVFAPGETSKSFTVDIIDNEDPAPNAGEDLVLTLSLDSPVNATIGAPSSATLAIVDDETTIVQFSTTTYTGTENSGGVVVRINRLGDLGKSFAVQLTSTDGSATKGSDYGDVTQLVSFEANDSFKEIVVPLLNDTLVDPNETVALTLSNASNGARLGTPAAATLTIIDDEPLPVIQFSATSYSAAENGVATITVNANAASTQEIRVDYTTGDDTATGDSDYVPNSGTLIFAPGETTKTFNVAMLGDRIADDDEQFIVVLSNPVNGTLGTVTTATVKIEDVGLNQFVFMPMIGR